MIENSFKSPTVTDDAGRSCALFDPMDQSITDPDVRDAADQIIEAGSAPEGPWWAQRSPPSGRITMAVCMLGMTIAHVCGLTTLIGPVAGGFAIVPFVLIGNWLTKLARRRELQGKTVAVLLDTGRCPGCAHGIGDITSDPAGRITCPECAASWNASRVAKLQPPPAGRRQGPSENRWARMPGLRDSGGRHRGLADVAAVAERNPAFGPLAAVIRRRTIGRRLLGVGSILGLAMILMAILAIPMFNQPWLPGFGAPPSPFDRLVVMVLVAMLTRMTFHACVHEWAGRGRFAASTTKNTILEDGHCPSCLGALITAPTEIHAHCGRCESSWSLTDVARPPVTV